MGQVRDRSTWFFSNSSQIPWRGCTTLYRSQKAAKMSRSRFGSGFLNPTITCQQLWSMRNLHQSFRLIALKSPVKRIPGFFGKVVNSIGRSSPYRFATRFTSRSLWVSVHLLKSRSPVLFAALFSPISETMVLAARMAERQVEASEPGSLEQLYVAKKTKLWKWLLIKTFTNMWQTGACKARVKYKTVSSFSPSFRSKEMRPTLSAPCVTPTCARSLNVLQCFLVGRVPYMYIYI